MISTDARFRILFEHNPMSMIRYASDGSVIEVNAAWETMWGAPRSAIEHYNVINDPQIDELGVRHIITGAFSGAPQAYDPIFYDPTKSGHIGKAIWMQGYMIPITDDEGNTVEVIQLHGDVTLQYEAKVALTRTKEELEQLIGERTASLKESEERFRQLAENIDEIFWLTDVETGKFLYISPAYETVTGRCSEDLYKDPNGWLKYVHPDDIGRLARAIEDQTRETPFDEMYRFEKPDKTYCWLRSRAFEIHDPSGTVYRVAGITEDITASVEKQEQLHGYHEQLRQLTLHQERDREGLRTNIAREIHDELGQALMAINMNMHWLIKHCPAQEEALIDKAQQTKQIISLAVDAVQRIISDLRPTLLDELGLEDALTWYIDDYCNRTGLECQRNIALAGPAVPDDLVTPIYRIVQESLHNIYRHADASSARVSLVREDEQLYLTVEDNGKGITPADLRKRGSFGLLGMRERIFALRGCFDIKGAPGKGTTLNISLPLKQSD